MGREKRKRGTVPRLGQKDIFRDISEPSIWGKRVDSDTDSAFWIAFSRSEVPLDRLLSYVRKHYRQADKRTVLDPKYKAAVLARKDARNGPGAMLDAALAMLSNELSELETLAAATGDHAKFERWLKEAASHPSAPMPDVLRPPSRRDLDRQFPIPRGPKAISLARRADLSRRAKISGAKAGKPLRARRPALPASAWRWIKAEWRRSAAFGLKDSQRGVELKTAYDTERVGRDGWLSYSASTLARYAKCADFHAYRDLIRTK